MNFTHKEKLAFEALSWVGKPYAQGGRDKEVGVDCAGLVVCCLRACGWPDYDSPALRRLAASTAEAGNNMLHYLQIRFGNGKSRSDIDAGDIVVFWNQIITQNAAHLGIVTNDGVVHANGQCRLVEHCRWDDRIRSHVVGAFDPMNAEVEWQQ